MAQGPPKMVAQNSDDFTAPRHQAKMKRTLIIGALIVHPILFLAVFAHGAFYGAESIRGGGDGHHGYGLQGGFNAMFNLFIIYMLTMGIYPLLISGFGVLMARVFLLVRAAIPQKKHPPQIANSNRDAQQVKPDVAKRSDTI